MAIDNSGLSIGDRATDSYHKLTWLGITIWVINLPGIQATREESQPSSEIAFSPGNHTKEASIASKADAKDDRPSEVTSTPAIVLTWRRLNPLSQRTAFRNPSGMSGS
jgi:hypothetical protein